MLPSNSKTPLSAKYNLQRDPRSELQEEKNHDAPRFYGIQCDQHITQMEIHLCYKGDAAPQPGTERPQRLT